MHLQCKKKVSDIPVPPRESFVSDIPAGDGNVANLFYSVTVTPEKLIARFVVMFPQVPETESTWLISERLEAATSVVGLSLSMKSAKNKKIHIKSRRCP
jgi:hypothetical protein